MLKIKRNEGNIVGGKFMWVYSDKDITEIYAPFKLKPLIGLFLWKLKEAFSSI